MKVKFKFSRSINGLSCAPGVHDFVDELKKHWFLKALVQAGDAEILEPDSAPVVVPVDPEVEKKLYSKRGSGSQKKKSKEEDSSSPEQDAEIGK